MGEMADYFSEQGQNEEDDARYGEHDPDCECIYCMEKRGDL